MDAATSFAVAATAAVGCDDVDVDVGNHRSQRCIATSMEMAATAVAVAMTKMAATALPTRCEWC